MAIQSLATIKSYLETNDVPTQAQFVDLVDTLGASNLRTLVYTVGVAGTTGMNHNFAAGTADMLERSIQLGGTTIIPANSIPFQITVKCTETMSTGAADGLVDVGRDLGTAEYISARNIDDINEVNTVFTGNLTVSTIYSSATSVWFSVTPNVNWNDAAMTKGKWKIFISFINNSTL